MNPPWLVMHVVLICAGIKYSQLSGFPAKYIAILSTLLPLYFAQNMITTSLVVVKIWLQHREARKSGLVSLNTPNLVFVIRIIVESAAIYTTEILVQYVLNLSRHPARFFFLYLLNPSIGEQLIFRGSG